MKVLELHKTNTENASKKGESESGVSTFVTLR